VTREVGRATTHPVPGKWGGEKGRPSFFRLKSTGSAQGRLHESPLCAVAVARYRCTV